MKNIKGRIQLRMGKDIEFETNTVGEAIKFIIKTAQAIGSNYRGHFIIKSDSKPF